MITDEQRSARGLRTVGEILELAEAGTVVLDPYSVLVGSRVRLGEGNLLYPGVVIECDQDSQCTLGSGNTLLPGTFITASGGAEVSIGSNNRIGEGGARITANQPGKNVTIGDNTRLSSGPLILGPTELGDGCAVLGQITAQQIELSGGADGSHPDPDHRGAVLKGFGTARKLTLKVGEVVNGSGDFADAPIERQRAYHPDAPKLP
jgi:acetyltransferase-like isoleucine patch superfamily enzyme